jgi:hypothetical protein
MDDTNGGCNTIFWDLLGGVCLVSRRYTVARGLTGKGI